MCISYEFSNCSQKDYFFAATASAVEDSEVVAVKIVAYTDFWSSRVNGQFKVRTLCCPPPYPKMFLSVYWCYHVFKVSATNQ